MVVDRNILEKVTDNKTINEMLRRAKNFGLTNVVTKRGKNGHIMLLAEFDLEKLIEKQQEFSKTVTKDAYIKINQKFLKTIKSIRKKLLCLE